MTIKLILQKTQIARNDQRNTQNHTAFLVNNRLVTVGIRRDCEYECTEEAKGTSSMTYDSRIKCENLDYWLSDINLSAGRIADTCVHD